MINIEWKTQNGDELECKMCKHYISQEGYFNTICLSCRHEYDVHTDEEAAEMDYPKQNLFELINKTN